MIIAMIDPQIFQKVMLHTFMDTLRTDGDREINHHGKTIKVKNSMNDVKDELFDKTTNVNNGNGAPTYHNMTQRNEEELVRARKNFYDNAVTHRRDYLEFADLAGNKLRFLCMLMKVHCSKERNSNCHYHFFYYLLVIWIILL